MSDKTPNQMVHEAYIELNQFTKKCVDLLERYAYNPTTITIDLEEKARELIDAFTAHWQDGENPVQNEPAPSIKNDGSKFGNPKFGA